MFDYLHYRAVILAVPHHPAWYPHRCALHNTCYNDSRNATGNEHDKKLETQRTSTFL